jgi:hypothetical protein
VESHKDLFYLEVCEYSCFFSEIRKIYPDPDFEYIKEKAFIIMNSINGYYFNLSNWHKNEQLGKKYPFFAVDK